ncbi:RNA polymerase sigma-70 factor (sigma-E family) [Promicromonospora sp. AC04]|uniref:SigE family RNA polymerase sigma factor n=1 Tax=Promicromonospora sp. AC04 TaxID=2135723 RepID=UPI000D371471|nr:SigE family RNA polymerase sigma factor [Promicromonospora sp. AC04]PUB24943.1 RNA polymerase sigma-70 factor (sigma-E family) [Promicromonospora sp. AC04]
MSGEPAGPGIGAEARPQPDDTARFRIELTGTHDEQFVSFVTACGPYLLRTAVLLCGDALRAEELVQATFERTYRSWAKARDRDPLAYARRTLVNLRIDSWRRTGSEVLSAPDELPVTSAPDHAGAVAAHNVVVRALIQLPLAQRRVVVLRHLLDLTEADTAGELGISVGTVKSHNARGLARLRQIFAEGERP